MPPFVRSYGPYFSLNSPTIRRKIVLSDEKMVDLKWLSYWCRVPKHRAVVADIDDLEIKPSAPSGSWRMHPAPYFPFFCVARRLKYPVFRPPRALRKEKHVSWIHTPTTGRGTSAAERRKICSVEANNVKKVQRTDHTNFGALHLQTYILMRRYSGRVCSCCKMVCLCYNLRDSPLRNAAPIT